MHNILTQKLKGTHTERSRLRGPRLWCLPGVWVPTDSLAPKRFFINTRWEQVTWASREHNTLLQGKEKIHSWVIFQSYQRNRSTDLWAIKSQLIWWVSCDAITCNLHKINKESLVFQYTPQRPYQYKLQRGTSPVKICNTCMSCTFLQDVAQGCTPIATDRLLKNAEETTHRMRNTKIVRTSLCNIPSLQLRENFKE